LNERDVWSFLRLHQLLAQSLQRCRFVENDLQY